MHRFVENPKRREPGPPFRLPGQNMATHSPSPSVGTTMPPVLGPVMSPVRAGRTLQHSLPRAEPESWFHCGSKSNIEALGLLEIHFSTGSIFITTEVGNDLVET